MGSTVFSQQKGLVFWEGLEFLFGSMLGFLHELTSPHKDMTKFDFKM